jgi:cell division protein FtsA
MSKKNEDKIIVGLDIGTSKVVAIVAKVLPDNKLEIIGIGTRASQGLKRGVVVNIDATVQAIQLAINEAKAMAKCEITAVVTGIAGSHIKSFDSHGIVGIKDGEVKQSDVERVTEAAKALAIPADQKIIHAIPQEFIVDNQQGIKEPVGMFGVRLEANMHVITGSVGAMQNIVNCVKRCNLNVEDIVLEQIASSHAILTEDEKELGVCLVDIGGGTTDIAIFSEGSIKHTAVIPVAGDQVTNDIAIVLGTPTKSAENIKINYGCAKSSLLVKSTDFSGSTNVTGFGTGIGTDSGNGEFPNATDTIDVPCVGGGKRSKQVTLFELAEIIEPRYEELFLLIKSELNKLKIKDKLGGGIVLTGGSAKIKGLAALGEVIFKTPVRIGAPSGLKGLGEAVANPIYSTGIGLLLYSQNYNRDHSQDRNHQLNYKYAANGSGFLGKIKQWLQGNL